MGEEMRNEKQTPSGRPAAVKPMNSGMDEQEQKGVTVPSSAAAKCAGSPCARPRILRLRAGGK